MIDELIDIIDEQGQKTGIVQPYSVVHKEGLFHRTVHLWVYTSDNKLLVQKRSNKKWAYPGYWEASVGAHLAHGEDVIEGICKESMEEIGLKITSEECKFLFSVEHPKDDPTRKGDYICHEIHDVYLVNKDIEISKLALNTDEVEEICLISVDEFENWIFGNGKPLVPHPEYYSLLIEKLK